MYGSETLLNRHKELNHKEIQAQITPNLTSTKTKTSYTSKRLKCNLCDKKFNKESTYENHVKKSHRGAQNRRISNENSNEKMDRNDDLPKPNCEVQSRVTRQRKINKN